MKRSVVELLFLGVFIIFGLKLAIADIFFTVPGAQEQDKIAAIVSKVIYLLLELNSGSFAGRKKKSSMAF